MIHQSSWGNCEVDVTAAVVWQKFLYQANWGHCEVEDNCCCSRAFSFFYTRLAGGIVKSKIIPAVTRQSFFMILVPGYPGAL